MNSTTALPLALYQANVDLQARLRELAQAGGQHWLELGQRLVNDGIVESAAEFQQILGTQDWQRLASLPADAFWRQLQQRYGDQQAATQLAVAAQASFARGLQEALQQWQQDTFAALDQARLALPGLEALPSLDPPWHELVGGWPPVLPAATFSAGVSVAPRARAPVDAPPRGTAAKKAPAKKTPVEKAAPAKTAAKKAANRTGVKKAAAKKATAKTAKTPARKSAKAPARKAAKQAPKPR